MDRGSWRTIVHGVSESRARLSDFHIYIYIYVYIHIVIVVQSLSCI